MKEKSTFFKQRLLFCCLNMLFLLATSAVFAQANAKIQLRNNNFAQNTFHQSSQNPIAFMTEDCEQVTPGNDVENGYGNLHLLIFANDIALNPGQSFSLTSMEVNILMEANIEVTSADIYVYEDSADGNGPGEEILALTNQTPSSSEYLEEAFGFDLDKITFEFNDPIEMEGTSTGAIYWVGIKIESSGEDAYMEITSITNTPNEIYYLENTSQEWISSTLSEDDGGFETFADGVVSFFGECTDLDSCVGELDEVEIVQGEEMEICENASFTLTSNMDSEVSGLSFQWQQKIADEEEWTDIDGADSATYTSTGITEDTDFRIKITCEESDESIYSDSISITVKPSSECYCIPAGTSSSYYINSFSTTNAIENISNSASGFSTGGYGDFTDLIIAQEKTGNVNFSANISGGTAGFRIWVDWNHDGTFSSDEVVYQSSDYADSHSGSFTVPESATSGETRMRIVSHWLNSAGDVDPCSTSHTFGEFEDYTINVINLDDCEGDNLSAGTPDESELEVCAGTPFILSVNDASGAANNLIRKWQFSPAGEDDWTDISESSSSSLQYNTGIMEATDFRFVVNCNDSEDIISDIIEVSLKPGNECYCTPIYNYSCSSNDLISNVSLTGESEILNNDSGCSDENYGDYTDLTAPDLAPGETYTLSVSTIYSSPGLEDVRAWIDFDKNGFFDESEEIANTNGNGLASSGTSEFEFTVPEGVEAGFYKMRVRLVYSGGSNISPCADANYGETEDYTVEIIQLEDCEGPVTAGTVEEDFSVCAGNPFTVSTTNASDPANGLVRQWQSSPAGEDDWTDIEGGNSNTISIADGIMEETDFRYVVTCGDDDPVYSDIIQVTLNPGIDCYCEPTYTYGCSSYTIANVSLIGESEIIDNSSGCDDDGFSDYTDLTPANLAPGENYELSVTTGYSLPQYVDVRVWIDFDQNGFFDEAELLGNTTGGFDQATETFTLSIPQEIEAGDYRMRVRLVYNLSGYTEDACANASYGETEDYMISIIELDECEGTPTTGDIEDDFSVCAGLPFSVSVSGATDPALGLTRQWQSSPAGQDDWTDIEGAHANIYNNYEGIMEDMDYRYIISCENSDETIYSDVLQVSLKPGYECYCTPTYTYGCNSDDLISNVSLNGESNTIDNDSGCSDNYYGDYTDLTPADLAPGETYTISVSTSYIWPDEEDVRAWIDYDKNGLFDADEEIANTNGNGMSGSGTNNFEFTVPEGIDPGEYRLRVRMVYSGGGNIDPCANANYGETEDYTVQIIELEDCEGPVSAGTTIDDFDVCAEAPFVIAVTGTSDPANGLVRQWQSSPAGEDDWTDIEGAHSNNYNVATGISQETDFRYMVTCNDDESAISDILTVSLKPGTECYCTPPSSGWGGFSYITNVSTDGALEDIDNTTTYAEDGYGDYSETHIILAYPGQSIDFSISSNETSMYYEGWLDINQDGNFNGADEHIISSGNTSGSPFTGVLEIPAEMEEGLYRLRIRASWWISNLDPCQMDEDGETEDYTIQIIHPECFPPVNIQINYITDDSAQVTWDANEESEWEVIYGETAFDPETEGESLVVTEPVVDLFELDDDTTYQVYVRTICGSETSVMIGPKSFTTNITPPVNTRLCDAIELIPNSGCAGGTYTNVAAFQELNEPIGSCLNDFHGTNSVWFTFVATNTEATISTDFNSTNFLTEIVVYEAPTDCTDMNTLGEEVGCANASNEGIAMVEDLTIGDTYYVKVAGFNNAEGNFCIEIQMDEAEICLDPTDVNIGEITDTTVEVIWTPAANQSQWEVIYGETDFDIDTEGESLIVNTPNVTLTELQPETDYEVYVRAVCGSDSYSNWSDSKTFTTEPMGTDLHIFHDFSFYPNPVKDVLNLKAGIEIEKVEIFNLLGQKILMIQPHSLETSLNTAKLQSDVYLMKVTLNGNSKSFRIVKK